MGSAYALAPPNAAPKLYIYPMNPVIPTGAASVIIFDPLFDRDYDFLWDRVTESHNLPYSIYLQDATRGRTLMGSPAAPIFNENIAGPGRLPYWLPKPVLIPRGTILSGTFSNRVAGGANTV